MADIRITNCHIHLFHKAHLPYWLAFFVRFGFFPASVQFLLRLLGFRKKADLVRALRRLVPTARKTSQKSVLTEVRAQYPKDTRFVVLPMDLNYMGFGRVRTSLEKQHRELGKLAKTPEFADILIPFAKVHVDNPKAFDLLKEAVEVHGFKGVKLYPKLGYAPDDDLLMNQVYPYCIDNELPVMSHCSRGGVWKRGFPLQRAEQMTSPAAFEPVLTAFSELRVCLAHFGGEVDWRDYIQNGVDPDDPAARERNFLTRILDMLEVGTYENLYTDISYTAFNFAENIPFLKVFLATKQVREKVLFGSDFYMNKQKKLSERAVSMRLRHALGETVFRQIAETNPKRYLGF